jgi:hypothetical protein
MLSSILRKLFKNVMIPSIVLRTFSMFHCRHIRNAKETVKVLCLEIVTYRIHVISKTLENKVAIVISASFSIFS